MALFRGRLDEAIALTLRELRSIPGTRWRSTSSATPTCASRSGTRRSPRCRSRSGSTRTTAGPTSCSAGAYMKKGSPRPPKACCGAPSRYDPNNKSAHYLLAQLLQQIGASRKRNASSRSREFESPTATRRRTVARAFSASVDRLPRGEARRAVAPRALRLAAVAAGNRAAWPVRPSPTSPSAAGLTPSVVYGGVDRKRFIIETNGCGRRARRLRRRRLARRARAERHPARGGAARERDGRPARRRPAGCIATSATARSRT